MATRTITVQANRAYDHLYDPLHTSSHPVDHYRATNKAMFQPSKWERVPDEKYMFSELGHYPRQQMRISDKEDLPKHVDRNWHPAEDTTGRPDAVEVSGKFRHKFFKRPIVPSLSTLPHIVMYEIKDMPMRKAQKAVAEPKSKTVGTQSLYRESESQTDPYSPDYVVAPNSVPEVLTLTHLTYGMGLPATEAEIKIIERTRQKRLFENMLPPPTDEFSYQVRAQLMEAHEFRDWAERERQITELQDRRLTLLKEAIGHRDEKDANAHNDKVERVRRRKQEERDRVLANTQQKRIKILRKMFKERQQFDEKKAKRDVIGEYADFTSKVYAPLTRHGHIPDSSTAKIEVQPADLNSYPGLVQLERSLPPSLLEVKVKDSKDLALSGKSKHQVRKEAAMSQALATAMESIKREFQPEGEGIPGQGGAPGGGLKKFHMRNILERPETPRVKEDVLPEEEEQEAAVLLLQRIIRGRAYQNKMFEGKEKRLDLINELRAAERFAETATTGEERRLMEQLREKAFDGVLESIQGQVASQTLDQLSKELLRFQEEKRIFVMVKLAERDRRLRQAQESGRRQAEERLREREDEMFRQIMGVHQGTVDSYLEEMITNTVEQAARSRALTEARLKAAKINSIVDSLENEQQQPGTVVRELTHSFMLPHVRTEIEKRRIAVENKRFSAAARSALDETFNRVEQAMTEEK